MGLYKGLKEIQQRIAQEDNGEFNSVKYLKMADGEVVRLRFLQELDADAPGYNENAGVGFLAVEHKVAGNFKRRFLCTAEDDNAECYGCEQHELNYKGGWKPVVRLYVNALIQKLNSEGESVGDPEVVVVSQGNGSKSLTPSLLEYALENGTITGGVFRLRRKGSGQTNTEWILAPGKQDQDRYDVTQHQLFDLNDCVRTIPYEEQAEYCKVRTEQKSEQASGSGESVDW